jgi:dCMP deaminase
MNKWDARFIELAKHISTWSKDPSTQVGTIIADGKRFIMLGYNGFPEGVEDTEERLNDRSLKYPRMVHGEVNAIVKAARDLRGFTLYNYPLAPCSSCAGLIIQSGIRRVVSPKLSDELAVRWGEGLKVGKEMFEEAGVKFEEV